MARLKDIYKSQIISQLSDELGYTNRMAVPHIEKIVVSMGVSRATEDKKYIEAAKKDLMMVTGQMPVVCKAKRSVSNFKVRKGDPIGLKVTLRKDRMYEFMDRLISLTIPRVRDFRGLNPEGFDGKGNYNMGLTEQSVFPEINPAQVEYQQGVNVCFVTTAQSDGEARRLLALFGMPFRELAEVGQSG